MKIEISVGDYINGFEFVAIKEDPFVKGINLWTNQWRVDQFGDRELVVFRVRKRKEANETITTE